jgi:hypothetical protein
LPKGCEKRRIGKEGPRNWIDKITVVQEKGSEAKCLEAAIYVVEVVGIEPAASRMPFRK